MKENNLVTHEREGEVKKFDGRTVVWVQTPETTGGQYSAVCTATYEAGRRAYPAHSHPDGEETIYVVTGTGKVKIGDSIYDLEPGSVALFPQGVPHMVWNTGKTSMKLACFYAPSIKAIGYAFHEDFDFPEFKK